MIPAEVITAIGKLNAHARAYGCGGKAIYAYKDLIAIELVGAGEATVRPVQWFGKCGRCDGTSIYRDWDGYEHGQCRHCTRGVTNLKFAEVTLPDGQIWHHPFGMSYGRGRDLLQRDLERGADGPVDLRTTLLQWQAVGDWKPRQAGVRLSPQTAVQALNVAETWLLQFHPDASSRWPYDCAVREMQRYWVRIDRSVETVCWKCGSDDLADTNLGAMVWPFQWSAKVCNEHYRPKVFWPDKIDDVALTVDLRLWASRRPKEQPKDGQW